MTFDLYSTPPHRKPKAPASIDERIAAAEWKQNGGVWLIRVLDICEYLKHDDKHGDEFIRCEIRCASGSWFAECFHEDRDDPEVEHDLGVADQTEAKAEALERLKVYIREWEDQSAANDIDYAYEQAAQERQEAWAAERMREENQ